MLTTQIDIHYFYTKSKFY